MAFDAGVKKVCRHNRYFGVRAGQSHVKRREGRIGRSGQPVLNRKIENEMKFLNTIPNWISKYRDALARLLLDLTSLRGLKMPKEKNPTRIVLADEQYKALLTVCRRVNWRFHVALVLAHETGNGIDAHRHLR